MTLLAMFLLCLSAALAVIVALFSIQDPPSKRLLAVGLLCCVLALLIERVPLR